MTLDRRYVASVVALASALVLWLGGVVALLGSSLSAAERAALPALTGDRAAVVVMALVVAFALAALVLRRLHRHFVEAPARLLEQAQAAIAGDVETPDRRFGQPRDARAGTCHRRPGGRTFELAPRHREPGARSQPRHRAGAKPARSADVGTEPERRGVQPGRSHPALQPPGAPGVQGAVRHAGAGGRRRADGAGPLDLRRVRPAARRARAGQRSRAAAAGRRPSRMRSSSPRRRPATCCA